MIKTPSEICDKGRLGATVSPRNMSNTSPSGFTVIELLAVISILALLLAIGLPAIQRAREAAHKLDCQHRQRNLGVAVHSFYEQNRSLPFAKFDKSISQVARLSVWVQLLPFLDQAHLFGTIDPRDLSGMHSDPPTSRSNGPAIRQRIPVLQCPSDSLRPGACSYRICMGAFPSLNPPNGKGSPKYRGIFYPPDHAFVSAPTFANVTDGQSNTVMFSEKIPGDAVPTKFSATGDVYYVAYRSITEPDDFVQLCATSFPVGPVAHWSSGGASWLYHGFGHTWYNHSASPNTAVPDCTTSGRNPSQGVYSARSRHNGGVHVTMADGSVKSVSENISIDIWRAAATRGGNEVAEHFGGN